MKDPKQPKEEKQRARYHLRRLGKIGYSEIDLPGGEWTSDRAVRFLRAYIRKLEERKDDCCPMCGTRDRRDTKDGWRHCDKCGFGEARKK